jgi:Na+/H+ antiporter NhaD/arsenite permease-like protein
MTAVAVGIFALTYLLVASRRLRLLPIGRPAGALLGALLMVATGVITPAESYLAIDHDTILLLFAMMLLTAHLEAAGFFSLISRTALRLCHGRPSRLLTLIVIAAGALSAFLVNDTVCLFMTPVLVELCRDTALSLGPLLIALATSANIGSAATLVGNPQNMIVGSMSRIPFATFLGRVGPPAALGLGVNRALLQLYYGRVLSRELDVLPSSGGEQRLLLPGLVTLGIVAGFFAGLHLGYTALAGALVLLVAERRDAGDRLAAVDWSLLVFFCGLFVVVAGLARTGIIERAWSAAAPWLGLSSVRGLLAFSALTTVGSNLISNVPMVLVTGPHLRRLDGGTLGWTLLAFTTTVAGNLTLVGSVANIIVAEGARERYTLGFWEYLRFGVASTLLVLLAGVLVLRLMT